MKDGEDKHEEGKVSSKSGGNHSNSGWGNVDDTIQRPYYGVCVDQT